MPRPGRPSPDRPPKGGVTAQLRHELRVLLFSPLTYIFQVGFLLALGVCTFLIADFYATDEASIRPMLIFLPWVALIMVPALAMRAWADEHNDGALELTLTLPLRLPAVVLGKFLAGYLVLLITLAFTTPLVATAYYLGEPDPGVVVAGYAGAALLLGVYYAVSLFAASLVREQVGAFVIGVTLLFVVLLLGWDTFGRFLHGRLPAPAIAMLAAYSPKTWLDAVGRGLFDFASVAYFVLVIAAALAATALVVTARRRGAVSLAGAARGCAVALAMMTGLAVIIPAASRVPFAVDLTAEGEFTLDEATLALLERLPQGVEATLYWSAGEASVPVSIKSHARRVKDLLQTLADKSGGRLTVRAVDPEPDTEDELQAIGDGVRRIPMSSGDQFYLGATFRHGPRVGNIPYFDIRRDRLTEYDIAVALNGLTKTRTPKIGVMSPLLPSTTALEDREGLSFMAELRRAYDIAVIPYFKDALPEDLDLLILIDTTILRREMLYAIDQFLMAGGGLIVMMDPFVRFNPGSNVVTPQPSDDINDISDLVLAYGVRYRGGAVVGDAAAAAAVSDQREVRLSFPYWMRLTGESLSTAHAVTAALNEVFFVEPGALALEDGARALALVSTTDKSGTRPRKDFADTTPRTLALDFKADGRRRVIAAAVRGPFQSAFRTPPAKAAAAGHLGASVRDAALFVIADVDWLFDPFSLQKIDVGGQLVVRPLNDNLAFLLNMVEYASGDPALISIRSRGRLRRPFTRVARLFTAAQEKYQEQEAELAGRIAGLEERVRGLVRDAGVEGVGDLPAAVQEVVRQTQIELLPLRRGLRDIRRRIRQEVDRLGRTLTALNLLAWPGLVGLLWAVVFARRRHKKGHADTAPGTGEQG